MKSCSYGPQPKVKKSTAAMRMSFRGARVLGLFASRRQLLDHGIDQLGPVREEIDHIVDLVEARLAR